MTKRITSVALVLALALLGSGCRSMFEVENPNELVQEDLERPQAARALVNGAEAALARALGYLVLPASVAGDELTSIGTFDAGVELDGGFLANPANEYVNDAWPFVAEARFQADQAVRLLEGFDADGRLADRSTLAKAHLYAGIVHTYIPDHFDDFVISEPGQSGRPLGEEGVVELYDLAIRHLDAAVKVARETGRREMERAALAQRARARHARGVWEKLNPAGTTPTDPWVADPGAEADALEALALLPEPGWALRLGYGVGTVPNRLGSQVNVRQEFRIDDPYSRPGPDGRGVGTIVLADPVTGDPDRALEAAVDAFVAGGEYPELTVVSAAELHLIAAEAALARGDAAEAGVRLGSLRELSGRPSAEGSGVDPGPLLRHERRVNLFLQGRRLADLYRFGEEDVRWHPSSDAAAVPGTFLPITEVERISNCWIAGGC